VQSAQRLAVKAAQIGREHRRTRQASGRGGEQVGQIDAPAYDQDPMRWLAEARGQVGLPAGVSHGRQDRDAHC
jgi:hypothetical protein